MVNLLQLKNMVNYKDIQDFPGYRIGENGTVWSCWRGKIIRHVKSGRIKRTEYVLANRWKKLKPSINSGGYLNVTLVTEGIKTNKSLHRLLAEAFIPNLDNKPWVLHEDDNKLNNSLDNLYWGTERENQLDAVRNGVCGGFKNKGERNGQAKLNKHEVMTIKRNLLKGYTKSYLAEVFGVSGATIRDIKCSRTWKHVTI